ncbi:MAG: nitronate monooxygenase [Gemmatimonadales bacterium]|nr:nitronate monooxygenase [Gemmatimonadales bacterium]
MGVGISNWRLARAVSEAGELGVVSGTAIDSLLVRRLQDGDPGGHMRRAMAAFPFSDVAALVQARFFIDGGKPADQPHVMLSMYRVGASPARERITMLAAFVEVWLAKEGHAGAVGINLLTKVQFPNLAVLYGAMLAGVDYVLMGAGIPKDIPGVLDALATHSVATMRLDVEGVTPDEAPLLTLDPSVHWVGVTAPQLTRPKFIAIVASNSLATMLVRKSSGRVDGFVVEGPTAGGHNAPPRGAMQLNAAGEPLYGERDVVDLAKLCELGVSFWVAGGAGSPGALCDALDAGAQGIQVGTLFAYCEESGMAPGYRDQIVAATAAGDVSVFTDPLASPTGYPFKVVHWPAEPVEAMASRKRVCDLGYLRTAFRRDSGRIDYRCPAEPVDTYVAKGGKLEDTVGRKCLCNALMADVGHAQVRDGGEVEAPLITSGDDLSVMRAFLQGRTQYGARDVIAYLKGAAL